MIASAVAHGDVCQSRAQSIRREHEPNRPGHFGPEALGDLDPREGAGRATRRRLGALDGRLPS